MCVCGCVCVCKCMCACVCVACVCVCVHPDIAVMVDRACICVCMHPDITAMVDRACVCVHPDIASWLTGRVAVFVHLGDHKCSCTLLDVRGHDALVACSWPNQPPVLVCMLILFDIEVQFSSIQFNIRPKFNAVQFMQFKIQLN